MCKKCIMYVTYAKYGSSAKYCKSGMNFVVCIPVELQVSVT